MRRNSGIPIFTTLAASTALLISSCSSGGLETKSQDQMLLPTPVPVYTPIPENLNPLTKQEIISIATDSNIELGNIRYEFTLSKGGYVEIMKDPHNYDSIFLYVVFHPFKEEDGDILAKDIRVQDNGETTGVNRGYSNELDDMPYKVSLNGLKGLNFNTPNGNAVLPSGTEITINPSYWAVISTPQETADNISEN